MPYIDPSEVISPKAHWHLFDVILDRKGGDCAYALGTWDGERRIGFRWNGADDGGPIGNPQSRGLPTWTMLDPALHEAIVALLPPEKQVLAKRFLGLRSPAAWRSILTDIRKLHEDQVAKIASATPPVAVLGGGLLVMHVVPFSAIDPVQPRSSDELFRNPDKFAPIGAPRPRDVKINHHGLLTGSNGEGLGKPQRSYVQVTRSGVVEAVVSHIARGAGENYIVLPYIQADLVRYARLYAASLSAAGITPPVAVTASLVGVKGMRLLQDFLENAFMEDLPFGELNEKIFHFSEAVFEAVPEDDNESAKLLSPLLTHLANTAGVPSAPYPGANGNIAFKFDERLDENHTSGL